jgi:hypothetical protein
MKKRCLLIVVDSFSGTIIFSPISFFTKHTIKPQNILTHVENSASEIYPILK